MELSERVQDLVYNSRLVAPLYTRSPLPTGRHDAVLLTRIRLRDGSWLPRGEKVLVWSTRAGPAPRLAHEWHVETLDNQQHLTLPAICLWLTRAELSPRLSRRSGQPMSLCDPAVNLNEGNKAAADW
ncbi:unnamed protein product [Protopolystoma xenopodis]|uniref:Uncharacterized protein n=1 Tax=Protopolystoma xenopodis TaxID=117903 RepID=A0A3S5CMY8_9PLAT|nr:unnamed protein product [Protopolystoma xenopodis]